MKVCLSCGHHFEMPGWRCPACDRSPSWNEGRPVFAPQIATGDGSDADYELSALFAAEPVHFWFRSRQRLIIWAFRRYFPGARSFFEVGCGTGFNLEGVRRAFPGLEVSGSDVLSDGLALAAQRLPGVALLQMDARHIPFENEFDVVGAFDVLEHVTEDGQVLAELNRVVRPGGGIILTVPQHPSLWSRVDDFSHHRRRYRRADLVEKVERAGFQIARATSFFSVTLPLQIWSRWRERRGRNHLDPTAELEIGRLANAILETVLGLERGLIRSGTSLPAGGSLLVVARRGPPGPIAPEAS